MKISRIALMLLALTVAATGQESIESTGPYHQNAAASATLKAEDGEITGYVCTANCLRQHAIRTTRDTSGRPVKKNAVGILTADGRLFVPVSSKRADVEARRDFLPLAGKCVRATGKVLGRGEWHAIDVERIEVLTHHTAD